MLKSLIKKWRKEAEQIRDADTNKEARIIKMDWYILEKCANELDRRITTQDSEVDVIELKNRVGLLYDGGITKEQSSAISDAVQILTQHYLLQDSKNISILKKLPDLDDIKNHIVKTWGNYIKNEPEYGIVDDVYKFIVQKLVQYAVSQEPKCEALKLLKEWVEYYKSTDGKINKSLLSKTELLLHKLTPEVSVQ